MITDTRDGAVLDIKVVPRAGRTAVAGTRGGALLVRLAAAPVEGAANAELLTLLSRLLGIPRRHISIAAGANSRHKRVKIAGVTALFIRQQLERERDAG